MKLSLFYCFAFTCLGCILLYFGNKLPEYLRKEKLRKYYEEHGNVTTIKGDKKSSVGMNGVFSEIENITKGNVLSSLGAIKEVPLEEAIREKEIEQETNGLTLKDTLLRKRRFLVFPEGSSFQLVFCNTYFTSIPIADIFYMGATASFAWELPQDPYSPFDRHAEAIHRKDKGPVVYKDVKGSQMMNSLGNRILVNRYTGEAIQPFAKKNYNKKYAQYEESRRKSKKHKKLIINPVFAKRSVDENGSSKKTKKMKNASVSSMDIDAMHREQEQRTHLDAQYMDHNVIDFHKLSRYGLYEKLEKLIYGFGAHGKECVLKALCEIGQSFKGKQGTFLEEIMAVIFTLPQSSRQHAKYEQYDVAHGLKYTCANVYPKCSFSIKSLK